MKISIGMILSRYTLTSLAQNIQTTPESMWSNDFSPFVTKKSGKWHRQRKVLDFHLKRWGFNEGGVQLFPLCRMLKPPRYITPVSHSHNIYKTIITITQFFKTFETFFPSLLSPSIVGKLC